jgi:hypothetical protein
MSTTDVGDLCCPAPSKLGGVHDEALARLLRTTAIAFANCCFRARRDESVMWIFENGFIEASLLLEFAKARALPFLAEGSKSRQPLLSD